MASLYVRIRDMHDRGLDPDAIVSALEKEGVARNDVELIMRTASLRPAAVAVAPRATSTLFPLLERAVFVFGILFFVALIALVALVVHVIANGKWC